MAHGLSCSVACGIFLAQGLNPVSPALAGGFFNHCATREAPSVNLKGYFHYRLDEIFGIHQKSVLITPGNFGSYLLRTFWKSKMASM